MNRLGCRACCSGPVLGVSLSLSSRAAWSLVCMILANSLYEVFRSEMGRSLAGSVSGEEGLVEDPKKSFLVVLI